MSMFEDMLMFISSLQKQIYQQNEFIKQLQKENEILKKGNDKKYE